MSDAPDKPVSLVAASAPGKLMISGEYAVLDGAVAVVASVSVRVFARWSPLGSDGSPATPAGSRQNGHVPPEAVLARELAEESLGPVNAALAIDATDLRKQGRKLGLGSSAAAAVAAVGAVLASHGANLDGAEAKRRVLALALAGHRTVAPEGSGADVAAAALGGFVRFRIEGQQLAEAEPTRFPAQVTTRVVWTGQEARTSEFVRAIRAYQARDAQGYLRLKNQLRDRAERFADAISRGDGPDLVAAADAYGEGMGALGRAAQVSVVTPELDAIAQLARQHGGAAKPSGAGGGDVALAFFTRDTDAKAFDTACAAAGIDLLNLELGAPGVRAEPHS